MAVYRQVYLSFWQDEFVLSLTPEEKYFYLYLITNSKTTLCGIYELPRKVVEFETGYNRETVDKLLAKFVEYKKINISDTTNEIVINNWLKYNFSRSPKFEKGLNTALDSVKDKSLIQYLYSMDMVSPVTVTVTVTENSNSNSNSNREQNPPKSAELPSLISYSQIQNLFNDICKSYPKVKTLSDARKKTIKARLKAYNVDDFKSLFELAENSDFLKGKNSRNWQANFDWLIKDANMAKVLDGNYNEQKKQIKNYGQEV